MLCNCGGQSIMRKIFKIIGFIVLIIAIPFLIDVWIFGNTFSSNIDNQTCGRYSCWRKCGEGYYCSKIKK